MNTKKTLVIKTHSELEKMKSDARKIISILPPSLLDAYVTLYFVIDCMEKTTGVKYTVYDIKCGSFKNEL